MFKVKTDEKPEPVVELFLEQANGYVKLCAYTQYGQKWIIAELNNTGMCLVEDIEKDQGIPVDREGRIKVVT